MLFCIILIKREGFFDGVLGMYGNYIYFMGFCFA